ncbi:hypothetical protein Tco_0669764 [Tanacetum coccineum]
MSARSSRSAACMAVRQAQLVDTVQESDQGAPQAGESQPLGSKVPLISKEFEASEPSGYRSSYETSSSSSPTPPIRKRYRGTSEHILDTETKDESSNSDVEREGHGLDDEGHSLGDEGHGLDVEGHGLEDEGLGSEEEEEVAPDDPEDDRVYTDIPTYPPVAPVQTPPSPEWSSGSLPVSPSSLIVPSPIASLVATPAATISVDEYQFLEWYRFRSLRREQERATMTFGALWRPVLALEAWTGHVDTRMAEMSRARYDDHRLIHDMLVQHAAMQRMDKSKITRKQSKSIKHGHKNGRVNKSRKQSQESQASAKSSQSMESLKVEKGIELRIEKALKWLDENPNAEIDKLKKGYLVGEHRVIKDINFEGMTYDNFFLVMRRLVLDKPLSFFYVIPRVPMNIEMINDDRHSEDKSDSDFEDVEKGDNLDDVKDIVDFQTEGEENVDIPKLSIDVVE